MGYKAMKTLLPQAAGLRVGSERINRIRGANTER
jgi:hypothetical protein